MKVNLVFSRSFVASLFTMNHIAASLYDLILFLFSNG